MTEIDEGDEYFTRSLLAQFATRLQELCQTEVVRFICPVHRKVFKVDAVESSGSGLVLTLEDLGNYHLPMESIDSKCLYRKHAHDVRIIPPWL